MWNVNCYWCRYFGVNLKMMLCFRKSKELIVIVVIPWIDSLAVQSNRGLTDDVTVCIQLYFLHFIKMSVAMTNWSLMLAVGP